MTNLEVVMPGDTVPLPSAKVGPGLCVPEKDCNSAVVSIAGLLKGVGPEEEGQKKKKTWVDYSAKRYVPVRGDRVVGVVKSTGRYHRVDIGSAVSAVLPELSFEGATKKNKPNLQVGELVYARVSRAHRDMEAELSCVDGSGKANGLGPLPVSGYLIHCSIGLARKLLSPSCPILQALGQQHFKFEVTVGLNGRVWVSSRTVSHTVAVSNAILNSEYMSPEQCAELAREVAVRIT